jgi:hypothetical protein
VAARTTDKVRRRAPLFGEDNDAVLQELGLDDHQIAGLRENQVVVDRPLGVVPPSAAKLDVLVRGGVYCEIDPHLNDVLARVRTRSDFPNRFKGAMSWDIRAFI